jgi:hypothetical protein
MNELLQFIIRYFSFLYDDLGARFVDSQGLTNGGGRLVLEMGELRIRFTYDRGDIWLEFQRSSHPPSDKWFSLDIVRQLLTRKIDDSPEMGDAEAEFVKANIGEISAAFSEVRHSATEKTLCEYGEARAKRLFG